MAGYRIGPFDVESVLVTHDQVIEAAVIGVPDQLRGEVIEAFVVLRDPSQGTEELAGELQQLVKDKFAAHAYPRRGAFRRRVAQDPQRQGPAIPPPPATGRIRRAVTRAPPRRQARPLMRDPGGHKTTEHTRHRQARLCQPGHRF